MRTKLRKKKEIATALRPIGRNEPANTHWREHPMNRYRFQQSLLAAMFAAALLPAALLAADIAQNAGQSTVAQSTPPDTKTDNPTELSEITVNGIRSSLQGAQAIKQES